MSIKKFVVFISFIILTAGLSAFAAQTQTNSTSDNNSSIGTADYSSASPVPAVPSDETAANTQTAYQYDLKNLIEKSKQNIKEVDERIKEQAILKRNQKREERAREYYEKGLELTNEGKLDEAREYFEKAIRITEHPEMAGYIRESSQRLHKEEEVEDAYREAVTLYKQKQYHPAKDAFEHVDGLAHDYRATASYLKIIDQDIIVADALAAKQQAGEIARQQKEAEAARLKEKQIRKEAIEKQAEEVYTEAVELYKQKKFAQAKKKFQEVSWVIPDYKATMKYLGRIDRDAQKEQERVAEEQKKALQEQQREEIVAKKKQEVERERQEKARELQHQKDLQEQSQEQSLHQQELAMQQKHAQELKEKNRQAQEIYDQALHSYRAHQWETARAQFKSVEELVPDFKHTQHYLDKIEIYIARKAKNKPLPQPVTPPAMSSIPLPPPVTTSTPGVEVVPPPPQAPLSLDDQQKQAQAIAELAEKSSQLYHQIADVADDKLTAQAKKKMATLDSVLNDLKEKQERALRQMQEEQWKEQQEESQAKREEHRAEAEKTYQDAMEYWRSHDYSKAKIKFLEVDDIYPDYKSTRRYLAQVDKDIKKEGSQAVTGYEEAQARHLKELQDKEDALQQERAKEEQEKERNLEEQQQESLKELTQKASDINDDIIRLSKAQDYAGMQAKFTELEDTVNALTKLKDQMAKEKVKQEGEKQLAQESARERQEKLRAQQQEDRQIHAYSTLQASPEHLPVLSSQPSDSEYYKRREIMQEQNQLFAEGVDRYEHKKYSQAKLLFGELADQHDRRAESWLKKVDRAITQELLKSQESEEKEQTAFLEDQLKAQRELIVIQERERQRQKKLTEEMERQKRFYEDDRLLQLRKEEILKTQERERQRQEAKRLRQEKENEKKAQMLRFRRIKEPPQHPVLKTTSTPGVEVVPNPVLAAAPVPAVASTPTMTPAQIKAQIELSNERKAFLDRKYAQEQKEKARQAKLKAEQDARQVKEKAEEDARQARIKAAQDERQKRIEEREKERQRRELLKQQREEERQARIMAAAQQAAQEAKRREDLQRQQEEARDEKIKQDQIMREETQHRQELEREEAEHQAQLEEQRESVRKQLEDGVEAMYQDALSLYNQGDYAQAADRFKDVQDILPGYKRSEQYMDQARQKSMAGAPAGVAVSP